MTGEQSATMASTLASGSVTASGTNSAPTQRVASAATTKSTELGRWRATRSPAPTPERVEPSGHPTDLVDQFVVAQDPIQISDRRTVRSTPGLVEDRRQDVGLHGCGHPTGPGWAPRTSWPGSSPVGVPSSKVTVPRFTVHR